MAATQADDTLHSRPIDTGRLQRLSVEEMLPSEPTSPEIVPVVEVEVIAEP